MLIPNEIKATITVYCLTFFALMIFKDTERCGIQDWNMVKTEKTAFKAVDFRSEILYQPILSCCLKNKSHILTSRWSITINQF
jgi:hypothetical protein